MEGDISLNPKLAEIVRHKVDSGEYASAAEVVEQAIYLLDHYDQLQLAALRGKIEKARASGPGIPADEAFAEIRRRLGMPQD